MNTDGVKGFHRRAFLQRAAALGGMGAASSLALQLGAAGEVAALTATNYKAIVCVFLSGGNDYANTLIPYDNTNYDLYSRIRGGGPNRTAGGIAYGQGDLVNTQLIPKTSQTLTNNITYSFNPELVGLKSVWDAEDLATLLNVGPLVTPLTLAEYNSSNRALYPLPPKLFSHNDQQSVWQSQAAEGSVLGWGGQMGDIAMSTNTQSALTCVSVSGNVVYLSGTDAMTYNLGTDGPVNITPATKNELYYNNRVPAALRSIITSSHTNIYANEFTKVTRRSMDLESDVTNAIAPINIRANFGPGSGARSLGAQLKMVARMIGAANTLGLKRQVFFVSLGGFDTHDNLMAEHPALMKQVNDALKGFYDATVELGVANRVTTFTASDFGRTLSSNSNGSDHGWGSHSIIMGGAVRGKTFYGTAPQVSVSSNDQVGKGRLLPTTGVDQLASTLGLWFGLTSTEISTILPNIGNFGTNNLGFL